MKSTKKTLILLLVLLLAFNAFLVSASAYIEGPDLVDVDINLEVGRYSGNDFTPLTPGEPLFANDIITVRIAPTTNFLVGNTRYVVMFTKDYLQIVGNGKLAFTPNYENPFWMTVCSDYAGASNIPRGWPASLVADGSFGANNAIAVNNNSAASYAPNGGYPGYLTGEWLFRFDLKVTQDITSGSGARVWMDDQWVRSPSNLSGASYFAKCLDSEVYSSFGSANGYYLNVDLTGANISLEPTAASETTALTVTKTETDMLVDIAGWAATDQYQIWSYQQVTSDLLLDAESNVKANQWILSKAYAPGSAGAVQGDGSIRFTVPNFISPTANYVMAVRVADASGNFIQELRGAFTPEDVGEVVINEIIVDDVVTTGYELKEIKGGAEMFIEVIGNNVSSITYTATILSGTTPMPLTMVGNELTWNISALDPGIYTVEFTATNGNTTATQIMTFELFATAAPGTGYGILNNMTLTPVAGGANITSDHANGNFSFRVREPGRSIQFRSADIPNSGTTFYGRTEPGIYHVNGYVIRAGLIGTEIGGFDDGMIRTLVIPRTGEGSGPVTMTFTADQDLPDVPKSTPIIFTAATTGLPGPVEYSFWRYDATGYVLVKDWSSDATLSWTPARIGEYNIEARAKGTGAGSYEIKKSLTVNITGTESKANITAITLNTAELGAAQAKQPIMLKADATSLNGEDLLYKFYVYDADMLNSQLKGYTVDQYCVWTPRKAGMTYTISVLVKNQASFGKYDAIESFEVTVS